MISDPEMQIVINTPKKNRENGFENILRVYTEIIRIFVSDDDASFR